MTARPNLSVLGAPVTRIRVEEDVDTWKLTQGFRDYAQFIRRLNDAVVGHIVSEPREPASSEVGVNARQGMTARADRYIIVHGSQACIRVARTRPVDGRYPPATDATALRESCFSRLGSSLGGGVHR